MKKIVALVLGLLMAGCGYSAQDIVASGQVKRVYHYTPIVCPDRDVVDISLGVLKNGQGSMSTQDMYLVVYDRDLLVELKKAALNSSIVEFRYDNARFRWCNEEDELTAVKVVE